MMPDEKKIIVEFLSKFLKSNPHSRVGNYNEIESLERPLNRIFKKFIGEKLSYDQLIECLWEAGITPIESFSKLDEETKTTRWVKNKTQWRTLRINGTRRLEFPNGGGYHFKIDREYFRIFKLVFTRLGKNADNDTQVSIKNFENEISAFFLCKTLKGE